MIGYHLEGDYWIPDLIAPESPVIGIWGERRRRFLRVHRRPVYSSLLMTGKLNAHLQEVGQSAAVSIVCNHIRPVPRRRCAGRLHRGLPPRRRVDLGDVSQ